MSPEADDRLRYRERLRVVLDERRVVPETGPRAESLLAVARRLEREVVIQRLAFPIRKITLELSYHGALMAVIALRVPDRDGDGQREVQFRQVIVHSMGSDPDLEAMYKCAVRTLYEALRIVMRHELDEAFHVAGVRVHDPHKDGKDEGVL